MVHGLELITAIRDFSPRPAIIANSGIGETHHDLALALGAYATLTKPVDAQELLEAVREAVAET